MPRNPSEAETGATAANNILAALQPSAPSLVPRAPQPTSDSSSSHQSGDCDPDNSSSCQQASTNTSTLPIVLGVVYVAVPFLILPLAHFD